MERQVPDLTFPFVRVAAVADEQYVFDGEKNGHVAAHFENARHAVSISHALVSVHSDGGYVVSQQDPTGFRPTSCTNYVELRVAAEQRPEDVVIEVLVRQPAQRYVRRRASSRSRMPSGGQLDSTCSRVWRAVARRLDR